MLKQARKNKLDNDWGKFKAQRRSTSHQIRKAKSELVKTKLNDHKSNPRKFWEVINESFGNLKNRNDIETILLNENNTEVALADGANYMNEYFCSIGKSKVNQTEVLNNYNLQSCADRPKEIEEFEFIEVSVKCVKKIVQDINIHKSSSILHLNSRILKEAFMILLHQLTHLFNCSLGGNIFPSEWK